MHVSLKNTSPLYIEFEKAFRAKGFTTCTSAVLEALRLFVQKHGTTPIEPIKEKPIGFLDTLIQEEPERS